MQIEYMPPVPLNNWRTVDISEGVEQDTYGIGLGTAQSGNTITTNIDTGGVARTNGPDCLKWTWPLQGMYYENLTEPLIIPQTFVQVTSAPTFGTDIFVALGFEVNGTKWIYAGVDYSDAGGPRGIAQYTGSAQFLGGTDSNLDRILATWAAGQDPASGSGYYKFSGMVLSSMRSATLSAGSVFFMPFGPGGLDLNTYSFDLALYVGANGTGTGSRSIGFRVGYAPYSVGGYSL